jgi:hypothetical protein
MLYSIMLYSIVLYSIMLYSIVLYSIMMYSIVMFPATSPACGLTCIFFQVACSWRCIQESAGV